MGLLELFEKLQSKWPTMSAASLLGAGIAFGWAMAWLFFRQQLNHRGDLIENLREALADKLPIQVALKAVGPIRRPRATKVGLALVIIGLIIAAAGAAVIYSGADARDRSTDAQPAQTPNVSAPPKTASLPSKTGMPTSSVEIALPPSSDRKFTDKTPGELLALYVGRTALQADRLMAGEKGGWIETDGTIELLLADGSYGSLAMIKNRGRIMIECRFGLQWTEALSRFNNGDMLAVRGKISPNQNGAQLYLSECELI